MLLLTPAAHGIAMSPSLASPSVADVGGRSILAASPEECAALLGGSGRAKLVWERLRAGVSPFYVSFVLAPLASNASELIAAYSYALKKTQKSVTISFTALEGAACMVSLRFPSTHTHTCIP